MITKKTIITVVTLILMISLAVTSSVYTITAHGATEDTETYTVRPEIYFDGYGYAASTPYLHFIHEDIKKNNRLLIEIYEMLEDFDVRIAGIEKALNIKPSRPAKSRSSSARPAKKIKRYGTD
jgi:hypothetical protein